MRILILLTLTACGRVQTIGDGTYVLDVLRTPEGDQRPAITLEVEGATLTVTTDAGSSTWTGVPLPTDLWRTGCPTNTSVAHMETWQLEPDTFDAVPAWPVTEAILVAGCALDSGVADALTVATAGSDDPLNDCPEQTCYVFTR